MSASQGSGAVDARPVAAAPHVEVTVEAARLELVPDPPEPEPAPPAPALSQHYSIVIGRRLGTVVVTVHGELDITRAGHLGNILADLIDGQGNLSLVVDLHDATTSEPDSLWVFTDAAERARRRGGTVTVAEPPFPLDEALQLRGLDSFVGRAFPPGVE